MCSSASRSAGARRDVVVSVRASVSRRQAIASARSLGQARPRRARHQRGEFGEGRPRARAGGARGRSARSGSSAAAAVDDACARSPGRCRAATARRGSRRRGRAGSAAKRSSASTSLTCAASRNFSPPNLTNGMLRRVSSSSSAAAVMRGAEQHRLRLQARARFAVLQHAQRDVARLIASSRDARPAAGARRRCARSTGSW